MAGPEARRRPQLQLTAGLRGAPFGRLAFGNPLVGHGGRREARAQPPVPASQVRKPAGRYMKLLPTLRRRIVRRRKTTLTSPLGVITFL